jgi:hypothetical protein
LCCLRYLCFSIIVCTFWWFVLSTIPVFLHYCVYFLVLCIVYDSGASPLFCALSRVLYCLRFLCFPLFCVLSGALCCLRFLCFSIILCTFLCFVLSKIPLFIHCFVIFFFIWNQWVLILCFSGDYFKNSGYRFTKMIVNRKSKLTLKISLRARIRAFH